MAEQIEKNGGGRDWSKVATDKAGDWRVKGWSGADA